MLQGIAGKKILTPFAASQSHRLSILLQLRNELIPLLDHVVVLFVLVIGPVRFDNFIHPINGAWNAIRCNEVREVPTIVRRILFKRYEGLYSLVQKAHSDAKVFGHASQPDNSVALKQLLVTTKSHLTNKPVPMLIEIPVLAQETLLDST
jgi:hypothetical protein